MHKTPSNPLIGSPAWNDLAGTFGVLNFLLLIVILWRLLFIPVNVPVADRVPNDPTANRYLWPDGTYHPTPVVHHIIIGSNEIRHATIEK